MMTENEVRAIKKRSIRKNKDNTMMDMKGKETDNTSP